MNIFEAKKQLNDFLREHPELQPMQNEINRLLKGAGSQNNRNVLLHRLLFENLIRLEEQTWKLVQLTNKA